MEGWAIAILKGRLTRRSVGCKKRLSPRPGLVHRFLRLQAAEACAKCCILTCFSCRSIIFVTHSLFVPFWPKMCLLESWNLKCRRAMPQSVMLHTLVLLCFGQKKKNACRPRAGRPRRSANENESLRPKGGDPGLDHLQNIFWQFVFPWVELALLKPMKRFPWDTCVILAMENKAKRCSFLDAVRRCSCGPLSWLAKHRRQGKPCQYAGDGSVGLCICCALPLSAPFTCTWSLSCPSNVSDRWESPWKRNLHPR